MSGAMVSLFKLFTASLLTRGRVIWIGLLSLNMIGISHLIGSDADNTTERVLNVSEFIQVFGMSVLAPFVSLLFAVAVLGDLVEDGSIIYIWMRPVNRLNIMATAYAGAVSMALPFVLVPVAVSSFSTGEFAQVAPGAILASTLGVLGYSAVFLLLGLRSKLALVWGLGYVLVWEAFIANASQGSAMVSIRGHMAVVFAEISGVAIDVPSIRFGWSLAVLGLIPVLAMLGGKRLLSRLEVP